MTEKICVITGGSRGIGLATARRFHAIGYLPVLVARNEHELRTVALSLNSGPACRTIRANLANCEDVDAVVAALEAIGRVDALVNNAGVAPRNALEETSDADFQSVFDLNVAAIFRLTRGVWPLMRRQGGGTIVNISSAASVDPFPGFSVYGASKAWVNLFTKAIADEGRPHKIRAFAVAPGAVETQMLRGLFPEFPTEQTLAPDDVAAVVEAVCRLDSNYASGETIFVRK